jgi:hypothetical protein
MWIQNPSLKLFDNAFDVRIRDAEGFDKYISDACTFICEYVDAAECFVNSR